MVDLFAVGVPEDDISRGEASRLPRPLCQAELTSPHCKEIPSQDQLCCMLGPLWHCPRQCGQIFEQYGCDGLLTLCVWVDGLKSFQ